MEHFTKEELEQAREFSEFYVDLMENNRTTLKYYLAANVVLDWFGKTIKEERKVSAFLKDTIGKVTHHISSVFPAESVAFKDSHHVKVPREERTMAVSPPSPAAKETTTPPRQTQPSTSTIEMGQGDGLHNCNPLMSPPKKLKLSTGDDDSEMVEGESEAAKLKYVTAEGAVEFYRPSIKKLQTESKWKRPAKLHIGYTANSPKDCTIYLIIYEGNVKCRRNLLKDFCESEKD